MTLEEVFQSKGLDDLRCSAMTFFGIGNAKNLSEDELIPLMLKTARDLPKERIKDGLAGWLVPDIPMWDEDIFEIFEDIVNNGSASLAHRADADLIDCFRSIPFFGIKPGKRADRVYLADEVLESVKKNLELVKFIRAVGDGVDEYASAATSLYGVVTFDEIRELLDRYQGGALPTELIASVLNGRQCGEECGFFVSGEYVLHNEFHGSNVKILVQEFLRERDGKSRWYAPDEETFLSFADDDAFFDQEQAKDLRDWLEAHHTKNVDDVLWTIYFNFQQGKRFQASFDAVEDAGTKILAKDGEMEIAKLLVEFQNNLRLRVNNGHTPLELSNRAMKLCKPIRRLGPKVDRNDPCPCGSGKKYKKCCGK